MDQQDHLYIIRIQEIKCFQTTVPPYSESGRVSKHDYILQRHANQELLSSRQNLAERADKPARPHLHHSKCKQEHTSFPNPSQGANELAKPRLTSNMQPLGLLPNLAKGTIKQPDHVYKCASQEHSSSCQDFALGRESTKPCLHHSTCKHLGSCQTLLKE